MACRYPFGFVWIKLFDNTIHAALASSESSVYVSVLSIPDIPELGFGDKPSNPLAALAIVDLILGVY
jgi:hypothetical protein